MPGVKYDFVATGYGSVIRAFENIEKAAVNSKKAVDASLTAASGGRGAGSLGAGGGAGRGGPSYQEKLARRVAADQEKAAAREKRAAERSESAKARIAQRSAANVERAAQREARVNERLAASKQRTDAKAAETKVRTEQRNNIRLARERVKMSDAETRENIKRARDNVRMADAAEKAKQRSLDKGVALRLQKHEREKKAIARATASVERNKESRRERAIGSIKDFSGGLILGAVATVASVIAAATSDASRLQESSNRISINSRKSGEKFTPAGQLRRSFEKTARDAPGIKSLDVADAVARFISLTGDTKTAMAGQGAFATVASATGTGIGDVAEAAASLSQQFDITGLEDMKEALAALTFQGKEGAFELKDAAAQFQRLAASGAAFGIPKGVQGVKTLGGLTQIARTGTGSAEQATTAVENLLTNLKVKQGELKGQGVNVYDKAGRTRDVRDLITESIAKVGGNDIAKKQSGLSKIFGEQGIRAINPLVAKYNNTFRETKGTDAEKVAAGMAVLRAEFAKAIDAPGDWADVQTDAAQAQKDSSAQLTLAWEAITAKVGDSVVPSLANLATKLAENTSLLDPFIEAFGLSVEVLSEFTNFLKDAGLLKKKEKTLAEQETEAKAAVVKFDKKHAAIGPLSAEDQAKRDALVDAAAAAHGKVWGGGNKFTGVADFAMQYAKAGGAEYAANDFNVKDAYAMGKDIQSDGAQNDWWQKNGKNETQAQTDVRHQFEGQSAYQKALDTAAAQDAVNAFSKATAMAAAAVAAASSGSGQQPGTIFAGQ